MTRLSRYILAELLPPLLLGMLLFTALLSFGYFFVSSQWLAGVPPLLVGQWLAYQVPDTLVKVLPMSAVLMTVVAFGRLNAGHELVAMQAGGIGLGRAAGPVAAVGAVLAALGLWLSLWAAPHYNVAARALYWDTLTGSGLSTMTGRTIDLGSGLSLWWQSYNSETGEMQSVRAERWNASDPKKVDVVFAKSGYFEGQTLRLIGYQAFTVNYGAAADLARDIQAGPQGFGAGAATNLLALRARVEELNQGVAAAFPAVALAKQGSSEPLELETRTSRAEALAQFADAIAADAESWNELQANMRSAEATPAQRHEAALTLSRKLALPLGNLVLALAALPFALRFGRSLGVSLGMALLVALVYYVLTALGLTLASSAGTGLLSLVWPWLGNVALLVLGAAMLRRA